LYKNACKNRFGQFEIKKETVVISVLTKLLAILLYNVIKIKMAEAAKDLNNCSSLLVNSEVNNEVNTCSKCKDYEKLLKETLDEIKSVQTNNRLLQKELLERTAHTNTWET